jgi:PiT family inorganic phosphate transporter
MPVSITQGVMGSIIGTGVSKGYVEINLKRVNQLILSWAITPLFSAFMVMVMIMISPIL